MEGVFLSHPLIAATVALAMGLASIAFGVSGYQDARSIDEHSVPTMATVEGFEYGYRSDNRLEVTFTAAGRPVHTKIEWSRGSYSIGAPVAIVYDATNPTNAEQAGERSFWSDRSAPKQILFLAGGVMFLAFSALNVVHAIRDSRREPASDEELQAMDETRDRAIEGITETTIDRSDGDSVSTDP